MSRLVRVLVVDDSAYVRKVMKQMLSRSPFLEVIGTARDGEEALELVEQLEPDVVTLDMNMPRMDGLMFLERQMARRPLPVVIVSIASESGELVLRALEAGAVDVIQKPTALANDRILEMTNLLVEKVKGAAVARPRQLPPPSDIMPAPPAASQLAADVVVIGVSTGGPQALRYLITRLPADFPVPIAIVLHMPVGYTELYARSLAEISPLEVREVREGDLFQPGRVLLARAGQHLTCRRQPDGNVVAHLKHHPADTPHRPAVDVLFRSAAETYGSRVLGIVLTGMGNDGTQGAAWIKAQGGQVLTEAESSCVVYGMPRSVVEAGLSDRSLPLEDIGAGMMEMLKWPKS